MKKMIICLAAGLLVVGAQSLSAQPTDSTTSTNTTPAPKHAPMGDAAKERQAVMKIIGLTRADLKDLTPAERREKMKAGVDKAMADLKAKKEAGTLTAQDKIDMEHLKKFLAAGHHKKAESAPSEPATVPPGAPNPNN